MQARHAAVLAVLSILPLACAEQAADPCVEAAEMASYCLGVDVAPRSDCTDSEAALAEQLLDAGCAGFMNSGADSHACDNAEWLLPWCDESLGVADGLSLRFNEPECDREECDRSGGTLAATVQVINYAAETIDLAMYGVNEQRVIDALCAAAERGVAVRVVSDDDHFDPDSHPFYSGVSYYDALTALTECGAQTQAVTISGLMHHKFCLVDAGTEDPLILTGSQNQTATGFMENHNNLVLMVSPPEELVVGYQGVFDGMFADGSCRRGTAPIESVTIGDAVVDVYFSPAGGAMAALRGRSSDWTGLDEPDPACNEPDSNCLCRRYYYRGRERHRCTYCALDAGDGDAGYGLLGDARERLMGSLFHNTDVCTALAIRHAMEESPDLEVFMVWDGGGVSNPYNVDELLCGFGVPIYATSWPSEGSLPGKNHNKIFVIDDVLITGSMNYSDSGESRNCENTLVIHDAGLANMAARYLASEVPQAEASRGESPPSAGVCRCMDSVDNDGDGQVDDEQPSCQEGALDEAP